MDYDNGRKGILQGQKEVGNSTCDQDGGGASMSSRAGGWEVTWPSLAVGYTPGHFGQLFLEEAEMQMGEEDGLLSWKWHVFLSYCEKLREKTGCVHLS